MNPRALRARSGGQTDDVSGRGTDDGTDSFGDHVTAPFGVRPGGLAGASSGRSELTMRWLGRNLTLR